MKLHPSSWFLALGLWLSCWALPVQAAEDAESARKLVDEVAAYAEKNGGEATKAAIGQSDGPFVKGELYAFAYDLNGVMVAHPKNPKLVGKNLLDVPDANGKFFRREIVELAKTKGEGWVDYLYKNPTTMAMEDKTTYLRRVGDLVICAGAYKKK